VSARLLRSSAWWHVLGGVVIGAVLTGLVVLVVSSWPQDEDGVEATSGSAAPRVPPPSTAVGGTRDTGAASANASPGSPTPDEEDEEDKEDRKDGKPEDAPPLIDAAPAGEGDLPDSSPVTCPAATVRVATGAELEDALASAAPGDSIELSDGTYEGNFETTSSGTAEQPIFLCGSAAAVLDGGDVDGDYTFHLDGAEYWRLVGFAVSGGQKGVMADATVGSVLQGLTVSGTGDEAIHLRDNSTDNVVLANTVSDTGLRNEKYGEGVYIGSAVSNWCTYTDCAADRSDRNVVKDNTITDTSSEAIDIKEGTTGGAVVGNDFDGSSMTGADSWIDVKGNNYLIEGNTGVGAEKNGMQVHQILAGWGDFNVFVNNTLDVGSSDYAIAAWPEESNVVLCNNTFTNAGEGLSNIPCT
jgi:hypothetical protein